MTNADAPARPVRSLPVTSPPLVAIRNLSVELGGHRILAGVNADIARGQITGLIGLNGSGKTTLLRAVVGEYPYRGEIKFRCGHDHSRPNPEHV
jgi:zinc transport system ATP-binding protein